MGIAYMLPTLLGKAYDDFCKLNTLYAVNLIRNDLNRSAILFYRN